MSKQISPREALSLLKSLGVRFEEGNPPSSEELCMRLLAELGRTPSHQRSFYSAICALAFIEERRKGISEMGGHLDQVAEKLNNLTDSDFGSVDPVRLETFCVLEAIRSLGVSR